MARVIYCYECATAANRFKLHKEDVAQGWQNRRQWGRARCPENHAVTTWEFFGPELNNTPGAAGMARPVSVERLPSLQCDLCGVSVPDSAPVLAVTEWRGSEPPEWESGYMEIVSEEEWHRIAARIGLVRRRLDEAEGKTDPRLPS